MDRRKYFLKQKHRSFRGNSWEQRLNEQENKFEDYKQLHPPLTIGYLGATCHYYKTYNELLTPKWDDEAQSIIDQSKSQGVRACCIHRGDFHHLYIERCC